jgi:BMFP domain-containing protein YqiC
MTQSNNRFFDDIARLMTDAAGAAQGVRREFETVVKGQIERFLKDMDLAKREEVDVLRDMVVAAREENEQLALRMKELEERLDATAGLRAGPASGGPKGT